MSPTMLKSSGSSPRMRGAHAAPAIAPPAARIIPAYAGSTRPTRRRRTARGDHPRVCGEHGTSLMLAGAGAGSSPRMRGARSSTATPHPQQGIIPAYAGSTPSARRCGWRAWDHPRVCGEHSSPLNVCVFETGSSPRMRGALKNTCAEIDKLRIIPAYAGSTSWPRVLRRQAQDHPRVCGEHPSTPRLRESKRGSSPRMRGAQCFCPWTQAMRGIIPAYAGSTLHEVHRFDSKVQFVYGCQGSVHCSVLQLFIPTGTGRGRQVRNADVLPLARSYLPYFLAALNLLALLQPVGGMPSSLASSVPLGLLISSTPSQSTGSQSG